MPVRPGDCVRVCVNSLWHCTSLPDILTVKEIKDRDIVYGTVGKLATVVAVSDPVQEGRAFVFLMVIGIGLCWSWPDWIEHV